MPPENYLDEPPERLDYTKSEWLNLSYHQQYYRAEDERRAYIKKKAKENKQRNRDWVRSIKESESCKICDEDRWEALVFHHIGEKKAAVSRLVNQEYGLERIAEEIEKCIILCSNCHRVHHNNPIDLESCELGCYQSKSILNQER